MASKIAQSRYWTQQPFQGSEQSNSKLPAYRPPSSTVPSMTNTRQSTPFINDPNEIDNHTKERSNKAPHTNKITPSDTLGPSVGFPDQSQAESTSSTSKYRNRVKTSSIELPRHFNEPRRRNSASLPSADTPTSPILALAKTRSQRSSTLSTTRQAASSSSRPHLRSRASTSVKLLPIDSAQLSDASTTSPEATPKFRPRAMSSSPRTARQTHPYRKAIIIFSILVSLFLLGTVIVLSSVRYYLAFPDGAFLTEDEVPWTGQDLIKALMEQPAINQTIAERQDWEELKAEDAVLGSETIPQIWDEISEVGEVKADIAATEDLEDDSAPIEVLADAGTGEDWGIDGMGTGSYWMKEQWDGKVRDTNDWSRLYNVTARPGEKIPRIIHQTWKNDQLPEKWRKAWKECREGMPDYEYMLWTDESAHQFMETHYPSFLQMYDSYKYNIQRADSIRYFLLHHFGGIYMDLDIGCRRRMDSLIQGDWEVILPLTKPVGVSNDLIFSSKGSAFIADTIHGLAAFNHEWFSNYPTVMFSTGPMFLSAQYAIYTSAHPLSKLHPRHEVRVLPKSLYGKNADPLLVPHSFFSHFYGSSWHADDAGFISFLGKSGITVMWIAGVIVALLIGRMIYQRMTNRKSSPGPGYQLLGSVLPLSSPPHSPENPFQIDQNQLSGGDISNAFKRAGNLILTAPATLLSSRGRRRQGLLYFVPAMFQPTPTSNRRRTASEASQLPLTVRRRQDSASGSEGEPHLPPPPYQRDSQDWILQTNGNTAANSRTSKKTEDLDLASVTDDASYSGDSAMLQDEPDSEWAWKEDR